jgi:hypothetical protein
VTITADSLAPAGRVMPRLTATASTGLMTDRPLRPAELFSALGRQLAEHNVRIELILVGGCSLVVDELVSRMTYDVDILAILHDGQLFRPNPLPPELRAAQDSVMRELGLSQEFLDPWVPEYMLALGLPEGLTTRLCARSYGAALTVHTVSRFDQIHFKYLAIAEDTSRREKHEADLESLQPSADELRAAFGWASTVLCRRILRSQMLLQEQLLRDGRRDRTLVDLVELRLAPSSTRYRLGAWMIRRPKWCGRSYGALIRLAGEVGRRRRAARALVV